jgi:1-phosphofructokinase
MITTVTLNPAVDHTLQVEGFPAPGTVARTESSRLDPGGKGINVSKHLVELGAETVATGFLGDVLGEFIRDRLDRDGVPADFVDIGGSTRLNTTILADDEYKINQHGPDVASSAVDDIIETIAKYDPRMVVIAGSQPPGIGSDALDRIARAGPWKTAIDVGGDELGELDAKYALCKPNRKELADATGKPVETPDECLAAAETLRERGFSRVVASLGSDGAIMTTPERSMHAPALDVDVVDTVGAGDALMAGVVSELDRESSDRRALRAGVAAASRAVAVPGTNVPVVSERRDAVERVSVSVK